MARVAVALQQKELLKLQKIIPMKKWFSNNTSKPLNSTIYGGIIGALLSGMFKKDNKKQIVKEEEK